MVEGARLESVLASKALRGFESLTLCWLSFIFLLKKFLPVSDIKFKFKIKSIDGYGLANSEESHECVVEKKAVVVEVTQPSSELETTQEPIDAVTSLENLETLSSTSSADLKL